MPKKTTAARAFLIGVVSGSRAATPLAVLALHHDDRAAKGSWHDWQMFRSPIARGTLVASAAGEFVGDKLPAAPSRIKPSAIVGRIVSGAIAGAAVGGARKSTTGMIAGAVFGGVGAVAGSYVGYFARKWLVGGTKLPDTVVALAEDVAAVAGARAIVRGL